MFTICLKIEQSLLQKVKQKFQKFQTHSKVTEKIKSLKFFMVLHVKMKVSFIYSNMEYANLNTLEKMRLLATST